MNYHNEAQDDMGDWAESTFGPGEACTDIGANPEPKPAPVKRPDRGGCGTRGTGCGPFSWLLLGVIGFALLMGTAHFAARWWL